MSTSNKAWFVDYGYKEWDHCYVVIHCDKRSEVKNILKRHLANFGVHDFTINRMCSWESEYTPDDWKDLTKEDVIC